MDLLPFVEVAHNNSVHSSTDFTSFKVATGQDFVSIYKLPLNETTNCLPKSLGLPITNTWPMVRKLLEKGRDMYKSRMTKSG